jgi:hypothetical protein
MALFVPKAAFAASSDLEEFRQLVGAGVGPRATWMA